MHSKIHVCHAAQGTSRSFGVVKPVLDKPVLCHPVHMPVYSAGSAEKAEWARQLAHQRTLLTTLLKRLVITHRDDPRAFLRSAPK